MGAWIETIVNLNKMRADTSHPSWVRGLKLLLSKVIKHILKSHPSWVRGLKQELKYKHCKEQYVAPLVGAWIETEIQVAS